MAHRVAVNKNGFTVLYQAPHPTIEHVSFDCVVFVHGFTGHPKDTWALEGPKGQSKRARNGRDDEPSNAARLFKIPRLSFSQSPRSPPTSTPSSSRYSRTETTDDTYRRDVPGFEGQQQEVYWPADLAGKTIPDSRVLTYGYDTNIRHWAAGQGSKKTVHDHAWDFLCSFEALRRNPSERCRPVLFVAHSLGGIVVKEALRKSRGCASTKPHLHDIFKATIGILFFGTPHRGADPRNFFRHVLAASAQLLGFQVNNQIVNALMPDAEQLMALRDEFAVMCHERKWQVYSFQEEYGLTRLFGTKVVDDQSSCLDDPTLETKQHISKNHMDMCRFSGLQDPEYLKVAAAMTFILSTTENRMHAINHEQLLTHRQSQDVSLINKTASHEPSVVGEQLPDPSSLPETQSPKEETPIRFSNSIDAAIKQSLVDQLYFTKIDERLTNLTPAQGKTCRWFLTKPEYIAWRDMTKLSDDGGFLWIKGNPGTGKSTLMKLLFEEAKLNVKRDPSQITLSFFFLARGTIEEKSTMGLYRSLLHQLFEKADDLKDSLEWMTTDGARGIEQNGWHESALKQTLTHAIPKLRNRSLSIFVDALDECDQSQVANMVSFFEDLCDYARETQVQLQICFSSRHYPTVIIEKGAEVTLEDEHGHTEDIQHYIKSKLRLGKSKEAEPLRSEILEKSSGIFLWVVLVLDILNAEYPNSSVSIKGIRSRLKQIPPGLEDLFAMILARDEKNLEQLHICLKWILFATRSLKPQELYFAIQLGLDKGNSSYWDQEDVGIDQMKTFVRTSSKGLAEVTRNKDSEVQFIHESVRDFLMGRYGGQWSGASGSFEGHCHIMLRDCCLAQLNASIHQDVDIPTMPQQAVDTALKTELTLKFPFLEYAVLGVLCHADSAQRHGMEQGRFLAEFPLSQWLIFNNSLERHAVRQYSESVKLIYILAEKNLAHLIRIYHQAESYFDVGDERYGPPFFAARATGSHEAVQAMLENLQVQIQHLDSPLRDLWEQYYQNRDKRINYGQSFTFSRRTSVLSHLAEQGDEIIMASFLLLSGKVDVDIHGNDGRTPLLWAAARAHETIIELLLQAGAKVDVKDINGRTPLLLAVNSSSEAVIQQLLNTGQAEVDTKDKDCRTPLSWAAESGNEAIVQQLLQAGAKVDAKDKDCRTPLSWTAQSRYIIGWYEAVVKQLLQAGAEVNTKDINGRTPLSWAVYSGSEAVIQQLLNTGQAEVDTKDKDCRTPLSWAAESGNEAIVQRLLEAGAKVDAKDKDCRTPLSWTAQSRYTGGCYEGIVKQLLQAGAEVDAKDRNGRTPLSWTTASRSNTVARLLLEKGADVNSRDQYSQTPLLWAAVAGRIDVVQLLLEKGAEVNSRDQDGQTPLSWSAEKGHEPVVRVLLENHASINSKDSNSGRTPLSWAAEKGHEAVVRLLLSMGADVDLKDNSGRAPISYVVDAPVSSGDGNVAPQEYEMQLRLMEEEHEIAKARPQRSNWPSLSPDKRVVMVNLLTREGP